MHVSRPMVVLKEAFKSRSKIQMKIKEHRIYKGMSEPMRFVGLTIDELGVFLSGICGFFFLDSLAAKAFFLVVTPFLVIALKKYKKMASGFSVLSYLHWKAGLRFNLPKKWPASHVRFWRS